MSPAPCWLLAVLALSSAVIEAPLAHFTERHREREPLCQRVHSECGRAWSKVTSCSEPHTLGNLVVLAGTGRQGALLGHTRPPLIRLRFLGHCYPCWLGRQEPCGHHHAPSWRISCLLEADGTQQGGCQLSDSGGRRTRDRSTESAQRGEVASGAGEGPSREAERAPRFTSLVREERAARQRGLTSQDVRFLSGW